MAKTDLDSSFCDFQEKLDTPSIKDVLHVAPADNHTSRNQ